MPGVGKNTAGAILAYAFNQPVAFVETNIRTAYIHHFFADNQAVDDKELIDVVSQTLDQEHPREFYWALMDYGSELKRTVRNIAQSKHYTIQSTFTGSLRQIRGNILRSLQDGPKSSAELESSIADPRFTSVLAALTNEQLISEHQGKYRLG